MSTPSRRHRIVHVAVIVSGAAFGVVLLGAAAAFGYWLTTNGANPAQAAAASLSAPTAPTATADGSGAVTVGWSLPASQLTGAQYVVSRTSGPGSPTTVCTVASTATSCQDSGLTAGAAYGYSIDAVLDGWQSPAITTTATTDTPTFTVALSPGPYTAGVAITVVSVTAEVGGSADTTYTGSKTLTWSGLASSPSGQAATYPSSTATFTNGVALLASAFTAYDAASDTLTATDAGAPTVTGSVTFPVGPGTAGSFELADPGTQSAGTAFAETVTAADAYGNVATGYSGSQIIAFTGPSSSPGGQAPAYPAAVSFSAGAGTASITLYDAQTTSLTATQVSLTGTSGSFTVQSGALASFSVNPSTSTPTAGTALNLSMTALDSYGNTDTAYTGAQCVTFSGPPSSPNGTAPAYPAAGPCSSGSAVTFSAGTAAVSVTLYDAQAASLTATDNPTSKSGSANLTVGVAAAATTSVASGSGQAAGVGTAFAHPLVALVADSYGNPVPNAAVTFTAPVATGPIDPVVGSAALANGGSAASTAATANLSTVQSSSDGEVLFFSSQTDASPNAPASSSPSLTNLTYLHHPNGSAAVYVGTPPQSSETLTIGNSNYWGTMAVETSGTGASIAATGSATSGTSYTSTSFTLNSGENYLLFASTDSSAGDSLTASASGFTSAPTFASLGSQSFDTQNYQSLWYLSGGSGKGQITITSTMSTSMAYLELLQIPLGPGGSFAAAGCSSNPPANQCVVTTNSSGDATSTTYTANASAGGPYTVTARASGTTTAGFSLTNASTASATKLGFVTSAISGSVDSAASLGPITVELQTSSGAPAVASGGTTVTLSSNSGGSKEFATTQGGSSVTTVTIAAGASSTSFYYGDTLAGTPTLTATATGLTAATQQETVTAGPASQLAFSAQPAGATADTAFATQPAVSVEDQFGNVVTSDTSTVALSLTTGSPAGTLTCSPADDQATAVGGVATFSGCSINYVGTGFQLQATDGTLTAATSTAFNVAATASSAASVSDIANDSASTTSSFAIAANTTYAILVFRLDATAGNDLSSITTSGFSGPPSFTPVTSQSWASGPKDLHEWAYYVTGGPSGNGSGTITASFSAAAGTGGTFIDVVQIVGNNLTVPFVTASESATNGSGTTATANLAQAPAGSDADLVLLGGVGNMGGSAPPMAPAMTSEFYSPQKPASAGVYFAGTASQNESATIPSNPWGTLALEINTSPPPVVTGLSPTSGSTAGGGSITVTGTGLSGATEVSFGATAGAITADTSTSITVTVPAHSAGTVDVTVTTAQGTSATSPADLYTYGTLQAPTVTSITPTSGSTAGGTSVTITGTNFTSSSTVSFGGASAASVTVNGATSITAVTPAASAGAVNVTVTTSAGTSIQTATYTYIFPIAGIMFTNISLTSGASQTCTSQTISASIDCTANPLGGTGFFTANVEMVDSSGAALSNTTGAAVTVNCSETTVTAPGGTVSPASSSIGTGATASAGAFTLTGGGKGWQGTMTCGAVVGGSTYQIAVTGS